MLDTLAAWSGPMHVLAGADQHGEWHMMFKSHECTPSSPADPGTDVWPTSPRIDGCPDPGRHAEGGHDV